MADIRKASTVRAEPWTMAEAKALRERYDRGERVTSLVTSSKYSQATVYRMLKVAGPPVAHRWTNADQQAAKEAYEAGASIRAVAASVHFSYGSVHLMLQLAGVEFRPRGGARSDPRRKRARS